MEPLDRQVCGPCARGGAALTPAEIAPLLAAVPAWTLNDQDGPARITRVFRFADFAQALTFTNRVGALAEAEQHHPAILTEWGRVTVTLWTHKLRGLHRNDFVLAAKIDGLA